MKEDSLPTESFFPSDQTAATLEVAATLPPTIQRSARVNALMEHVAELIESSQQRENITIPTYAELAEQFEYASPSGVFMALKSRGLHEEIKAEKQNDQNTDKEIKVIPSSEWAWMLGLLSCRGSIENRRIKLRSQNRDLLKAFETMGEILFQINPSNYNVTDSISDKKSEEKRFKNLHIAKSIGDLSRNNWPQVIIDRHPWILKNPKYLWSFISGLFDARGLISKISKRKYYRLEFSFGDRIATNFLAELLVRAGLHQPNIGIRFRNGREVVSLTVTNGEDLQYFAQYVHSKVTKKEEQLQEFREHYSKRTSRFGRINALTKYITQLIERKQQGETITFPSYKELAIQFGYKNDSGPISVIKRAGLLEAVRPANRANTTDNANLITYVTEIIKRRQQEEFVTIPPYRELAQQFGYASESGPYTVLKRAGLIEAVRVAKREEKRKRKNTKRILDEQLIAEFQRLTNSLNHRPSSEEIKKLRRAKKTRYSGKTYSDRFGDGSYPRAMEMLTGLLQQNIGKTEEKK